MKYDKCESAINHCHYAMSMNPLCTCDKIGQCLNRYDIITNDGEVYILYKCQDVCQYFIKDLKAGIKTILEPLNSSNIYYDKDLGNLIKKLFKDKKGNDLDKAIDYLSDLFIKLNTRC